MKKIIQRQLNELTAESFFLYILEHWKISSGEHSGEKFSFKDRPYMVDIAKDQHNFKVEMKSAQCGISEINAAEAIWRSDKKKGNILYVLPAAEQLEQFVDARIRNAVIQNDYLHKLVTGSLNLKKFEINHNTIYFRGAQKRNQIITMDVSAQYLDELDEYGEGIVYTLSKRLGAALQPIKRYYSTPTFDGTGISLYYYGSESQKEKGSDRRVWSIRCPHCNKFNEDLIWEKNTIDLNRNEIKFAHYRPDIKVICRYCSKFINRLSNDAQWIAEFPSLSEYCHGYHISKLFSVKANLNDIASDLLDPVKEMEVYNSDLGLPFEPVGARISDVFIDNARGQHQVQFLFHKCKTICGMDIGKHIHAIASYKDEDNRYRIVGIQELDSWDDVPYFYKDMSGEVVVVDGNPDKKEAIEFQRNNKGVWLAYYSQHLESKKDSLYIDWSDGTIQIHRTLLMMMVSDFIMNRIFSFPIDCKKIRDFYDHLKSPIKAEKQNEKGDMISFYPKTKNPDHYYHTLLYTIVAHMVAPKPAQFLIKSLTP